MPAKQYPESCEICCQVDDSILATHSIQRMQVACLVSYSLLFDRKETAST